MSLVSSVVVRSLPQAVLVLALELTLEQALEDPLVLAQVLVQSSCDMVVVAEVCLCFRCSPAVVVSPEFVIHVSLRLPTAVVSAHLLPTLVTPQARWLTPSQVQPACQQS